MDSNALNQGLALQQGNTRLLYDGLNNLGQGLGGVVEQNRPLTPFEQDIAAQLAGRDPLELAMQMRADEIRSHQSSLRGTPQAFQGPGLGSVQALNTADTAGEGLAAPPRTLRDLRAAQAASPTFTRQAVAQLQEHGRNQRAVAGLNQKERFHDDNLDYKRVALEQRWEETLAKLRQSGYNATTIATGSGGRNLVDAQVRRVTTLLAQARAAVTSDAASLYGDPNAKQTATELQQMALEEMEKLDRMMGVAPQSGASTVVRERTGQSGPLNPPRGPAPTLPTEMGVQEPARGTTPTPASGTKAGKKPVSQEAKAVVDDLLAPGN